jgi:hypothetical protein
MILWLAQTLVYRHGLLERRVTNDADSLVRTGNRSATKVWSGLLLNSNLGVAMISAIAV